MSRPAATLAGAFAIAMWSFSGLCYAAGTRTLGAMGFLVVSSGLGVLTILVFRLARGQSIREMFLLPRRVVVAGFFGIVVYSLLLGSAMGMAPKKDAAHVMLLNYLWPIWIVLLSLVLLDEPVRPMWAVVGAILGFAGVVIARGTEVLHVAPASLLPHAMAAAGGFLWALYSVLLRRWKIPAEQGGSSLQFLLLCVTASAIASARQTWPDPARIDLLGLGFTLFCGVGPVGLAYYGWEIGMKRGAVQLLALLSFFIPIVSPLLIAAVFHEAMSPLLLPGAAMIAAGAWIGQRATRRRPAEDLRA